jgi:hypothetical protein
MGVSITITIKSTSRIGAGRKPGMSRGEAKQALPWATVLTVSVTLGLALLSKLERMDEERVALRVEMERRLTRIEAKLDGLLLRKGRVVALVRESR